MSRWLAVSSLALLASSVSAQSDPLRVFLRGGPKTHGPGQHDHPRFVEDWKALLAERGAIVDGALEFPTAEQLARTDVLVLYAAEGGSIHGGERANLERFLARGGGIVALHDAVCGDDPQWFKTAIGGAWEHGHSKWHEGTVDLYLTDIEHPITAGAANFRFEDEIYHALHVVPEANVLMQGFHSVFDITPQMWTYERAGYRAFVSIQGHNHESFSHPAWRTLLLRGIAWAGKRDVASLIRKGEAEALRYPPGGPTRPEEASKLIDLHPDFELSLAAAEPLVVKPICVDWDARGRMWVAMTPGYPEKERFSGRPAHDEIAILTDSDGDGRMDERKTFVGGLDLVTTFVFHGDGVIVGQAPNIYWLRDKNGDDVCDANELLYTGFGFSDTHAVMSSFRSGPDGWIYATQGYSGNDSDNIKDGPGLRYFGKIGNGLFRFRPDGSAIEMVSSYGSNTWGCDFSSEGELFFTMANGAHLRHVVLPERYLEGNRVDNVTSWADCPDHDRVIPAIVHEDAPYAQIDFVGGFTAASGCTLYKGGAWPSEWTDAHFVCEPTVHIVHHDVIQPKGVTFTAHKAREQEFIAGRDLWFRPVDTRVGPDGALYVLDFYNQAVVHNDTRGPPHGKTNFAIRPDRDHDHGRIWRVQHKDAAPIARTDRIGIAPDLFAARATTVGDVMGLVWNDKTRSALVAWIQLGERAPDEKTVNFAIESWPELRDPWTRSAVARCVSQDLRLLLHAIGSRAGLQGSEELVSEATRIGVRREEPGVAEGLLAMVAARVNVPYIRLATIRAIERETTLVAAHANSATNKQVFERILADPEERVAVAALQLVSRWKLDGALGSEIDELAVRLAARLADPDAYSKARVEALAALLSIPSSRSSAIEASGTLLSSSDSEIQFATLAALGRVDDPSAAVAIVEAYPWLAVEARDKAFDLLVARASWTAPLLDAVEGEVIALAELGPQKMHRLRTHPDAATAQRGANALVAVAGAANPKLDELLAKLLPEVDRPGDRAAGKLVFAQNCATCHTAFGEGSKVGPDLSGMGAHGARDLLPIILDPNRAVEAAYAEWVVKTHDERNFAGVLVRDTKDSVLLRSSSGDAEVAREDIAEMRNTGRSPMPAGLETLGAPALCDLIAYLAGDYAGYRVLDLKKVVSSSSLAGLYDTKRDAKPMKFARYGVVELDGVPFELLDPRRTDSGCNALVLKGGLVADWESKLARPQRVDVRVGCVVERVHVLGGIGGWAYPYIKDVKPVVKWTWRFADGTSEETVLQNGVEFADWIGRHDVPGSEFVEGALADDSWGQVRRFTLEPRAKKTVESIVLESYDNEIAPTIVALTAELPGAAKRAATPIEPLDVLILGGGSSHDFERWFRDADLATLKASGIERARFTSSPGDALKQFAQLRALVLCTNQPVPDSAFREGVFGFVEGGGGLLVLHPAAWFNWTDWPEYNARLVGGGSSSHEKLQEFEVRVVAPDHELARGLPATFRITDELYRFVRDAQGASIEVLAIGRSLETGAEYPVAWTVARERGRTVCITLGHDGSAHEHPAFQKLLANAARWITQP